MRTILTVNRGSSSLKLAVFECRSPSSFERTMSGSVSRIDEPGAQLVTIDHCSGRREETQLSGPANDAAVIERLAHLVDFRQLAAVGHRIVHGGPRFRAADRVSDAMLAELRRISSFAPDHLPPEIDWIEAIRQHYPELMQIAAFDTAFHRQMPRVARMLPIPRRYEQQGVERYGFHGLSYEYLIEELGRLNPQAADGRVILAHLGAGASMAAVLGGKSIDTSMAFTPTAGLPMATRSGDLDPGLVAYLARTEQMTPQQFDEMVNRRSGLLGVSDTTGDMQQLLAREPHDERAREAIELFCYQARKWIGTLTAALGGIDALVFAGGIGEHASALRERICSGLACLGIELDEAANAENASVVSANRSAATVYVIATNEELVLARSCWALVEAQEHK